MKWVLLGIAVISLFLIQCTQSHKNSCVHTYCNPVSISYRFCIDTPSRREAADPTVVRYKNTYYLFASKSGGYWSGTDLGTWKFIPCTTLPTEDYAPTAIVIGDTLYFMASSHSKNVIYKTTQPETAQWHIACDSIEIPMWDPAFFLDDDNSLYVYWGCSNQNPIYGAKIDYTNNFKIIGEPKALLNAKTSEHGWEVPGDYNTLNNQSPWIEGAWVNKHNGTYYLQYSGPGTEFMSYCDAVYVADSPLGPYSIAQHNPFSYKPAGFINGAGHGNTFADVYGNMWHIATGTISQKHMFERRLVLHPVQFDNEGTMYSYTKFGDYPHFLPHEKKSKPSDLFTGWMLLSYNKKVQVSSTIAGYEPANMTDENIRTYWAAQTGNKGEFAYIDLGEEYDVYALQINFAEHATSQLGRNSTLGFAYTIEYSLDGSTWELLIDKSKNKEDISHDYIQLPNKQVCRYVRITNISVVDGVFALSGFRVFGKGNGAVPQAVDGFAAQRAMGNKKQVTLSWKSVPSATGYVISYGSHKDRLYSHYMVYADTSVVISSLSTTQAYYYSIEAFNEHGVSKVVMGSDK